MGWACLPDNHILSWFQIDCLGHNLLSLEPSGNGSNWDHLVPIMLDFCHQELDHAISELLVKEFLMFLMHADRCNGRFLNS